ncbi:putative receptor-like protein kinase At3g47110 [Apium graveolens]|uniref:putative receptor-like protein kinase At3g47110 n=1 Tax=Apium graveolens TaxID=4045 RepID=UPI003D7A8499
MNRTFTTNTSTTAAFSLPNRTTMIFNLLLFNILFVFLFGTSTTFISSFPSNVTDEQTLLSFKSSIRDDPMGALHSWNTSIHFCHWTGVICSRRRQRVTILNLSSLHLVGTLSPHIGNLSFLRRIYLYQNSFHGPIPNEIGRLFRLQYLYLNDNSFEGGFPANLSHCIDIRNISLSANDLEGELPTDFSPWSKLYKFNLGNNHFTGSIPPSIANVSSLRVLSLLYNNLVGMIPFDVSHLAKLEFLSLSANRLSGMVPQQLYNNSFLSFVSLVQNELEGTLPTDLGFTLPRLREFYAGANSFSGPLPPSIVNASNLVSFDIFINNITGPIPNNLGSLSNIEYLGLGHNPLGDNMQPGDLSFFDSLVNCTNLKLLSLDTTSLSGKLPISIVNLSTNMEKLLLHKNLIYGSIPHEIGKLLNMKELDLSENLLTGTIPESIGELSTLGQLDLSKNNISSGTIPTSFGNFTHLVYLYLESNMLQGSIPTQLFYISTLQEIFLADNRLRGVLPDEIAFSSHCVYLNLSKNLFTGPLPSNIGSLKQLVGLDVSYNKLTGDIPATLDGCLMLQELYMAGNHFQGKIPSSFKTLKNLRYLDLSNNNISGSIPSFFDGNQMMFLDLSYNKLGGQVSKKGLFSNVSAFSIIGNSELCGGIQALNLSACPVKVSRNKKTTFSFKMILILVIVPLGVMLACLALIFYRRRNSKKLNEPIPVLKDNPYPKLSYQDLLLATNEFSPENFIGEGRYGSVYMGILELVEHIVAVKVLKVEVRGASKSFLAECETLRNIRHRNLIKIITVCSSTDYKGNDFKALVFEFMKNGSLDSWLHPSPHHHHHHHQGNERNLNLLQRLNIAIDIALGVDYLHHHSHANIIHCDIKPSNILLDEDFIARLGDFGLARFCVANTGDINQAQLSSTGIRGTIGYVPPEYGICGDVSAEGDVYSYGVLLLEMFSGKRPTESSLLMDNTKDLHDYVRKALPQRVMDIVDPRIVIDQEEHGLNVNQSYRMAMEICLTSIFEVGILCSEQTPAKRVDISVAIKLLHVARDKFVQCRQ